MYKTDSVRRVVCLAVSIFLYASGVAVSTAAEPTRDRANAPGVDEMLNWLSTDTESICVVQEPFKIAAKPDPQKPESLVIIEALFRGPSGIGSGACGARDFVG